MGSTRNLWANVIVLGCAGALLVGCSSEDDAQNSPGSKPCTEQPARNPFDGFPSIPVKPAEKAESGITFHIGRIESHSDACTPLSWVTLSGTNDREQRGATAGANREAVALFVHGKLVPEPEPILALRIANVERMDEATVRVHYEFFSETPAAVNKPEPGSATFHWTGSDHKDGKIEVTENSIPMSQNKQAETLDLTAVNNQT